MSEAKGVTGTVIFDGQFVTIARTGLRARAMVGKGDKRIPVGSITAVQWKPAGMMNGFIEFTVGGGNEGRSRFGSATQDAMRNENAVVFHFKQAPAFEAIRGEIEDAIASKSSGTVIQAASAADDLVKFAELHASGVLTDEEFAAKKAQLLGL